MALSTIKLQGLLDALNLAIASGATRVSYDGKSVEYRSLVEMKIARDDLMRQLGLVSAGATRRSVASFSSGLW